MKIETFVTLKNEARLYSKGGVTVEFAIIMVVLLLIVAGAIGFGRAYWYADALTKATRDGARLLSTWTFSASGNPSGIIGGVVPAQTLTVNSANAANISPQLTANNVVVECLNAAFTVVNCSFTSSKPDNVRVRIIGSTNTDGFSVNLSEWMPFVGGQAFGTVSLSPQTTMRYMN